MFAFDSFGEFLVIRYFPNLLVEQVNFILHADAQYGVGVNSIVTLPSQPGHRILHGQS